MQPNLSHHYAPQNVHLALPFTPQLVAIDLAANDATDVVVCALDKLHDALEVEPDAYLLQHMNWHGGDLAEYEAYMECAEAPIVRGAIMGALVAEEIIAVQYGMSPALPSYQVAWASASALLALLIKQMTTSTVATTHQQRTWYARLGCLPLASTDLSIIRELLDTSPGDVTSGFLLGFLIVRQPADDALALVAASNAQASVL